MDQRTMTLEQIREKGLAILRQHLGVAGMVRFLQQSEIGRGDYTEERYQWLGDPDLKELAKQIVKPEKGSSKTFVPPSMKPWT